ncbi:DMT family transporter [Streptomyces sp. NPDC057445]|uniref:EamA family transporter n=1 Tax=Streptomyces sp. NPDC057445 TaxID=3346136 RepID=UPI003673B582
MRPATTHRAAPARHDTPTPPQPRSGPFSGIATMLGSGLSNQVGAAVGSLAFPALGPLGVAAVRQCVAAIALLAVARPQLRALTWQQWWPVLLLALVFATMNLSLYGAIDRIGLGLAVTLEFLGPLSIALSTSRRRMDMCCAVIAAAGVTALMRPRPTTDYVGMGLALVAAVCWASYILLNRTVGRRVPGAQGSAAAAGLSALLFLPVGLAVVVRHPPSPGAVACAVAAGILSSAVPFLADLFTLRHVPAQAFGLFMSVNPVLAAVVGQVALGQNLGWTAWCSIGAIVAANALSILTSASRSRRSHGPGTHLSLRSPPSATPAIATTTDEAHPADHGRGVRHRV